MVRDTTGDQASHGSLPFRRPPLYRPLERHVQSTGIPMDVHRVAVFRLDDHCVFHRPLWRWRLRRHLLDGLRQGPRTLSYVTPAFCIHILTR